MANGSGQAYSAGDKVTVDAPLVLYAQWAYPVTYHANGGKADTVPEAQVKVPGESLTLHSGIPSRDPDKEDVVTTLVYNNGDSNGTLKTTRTEDWTFKGWATEEKVGSRPGVVTDEEWTNVASEKKYAPGGTYATDAELNLYAQWRAQNPSYGSAALPTPKRDGYDFLGWTVQENPNSSELALAAKGGTTITPEADSTLYAQWEKKTYTVAYDANGGSGAPSSDTKTHGDDLTLSTTEPTRGESKADITLTLNYKGGSYKSGDDSNTFGSEKHDTAKATATTTYTFQGWDESATATATTVTYPKNGSVKYSIDASTTLYAVWDATTKDYKSYTLPDATHPKTGEREHTFQGWTTAQYISAEWKDIPDGSKWEAGASYGPVQADTTLYAVWDPPAYAIEYDANAGDDTVTGDLNPQSDTADVNVTLHDKLTRTPKKASFTVKYDGNGAESPTASTATNSTEYTFTAWNTKADGNGTSYEAKAPYKQNADVKLYAQWTKTESSTPVTLPKPPRTGYSFQGWFTEATDGTRVGGDGDSYTPTDDITLYAQWKPDEYAVTYDVNGGDEASKPAAQVKLHDVDLTLSSTVPTRADVKGAVSITYDANGGTADKASDAASYKDTYTFLQWKAGSLNYAPGSTYAANAAAEMVAQWADSTAFGDVELPGVQKREGYDFLGWYTDATNGDKVGDAGDKYEPASKVAVTLYAHWDVTKYDVTYNKNTEQTVESMPAAEKKTHGDSAFTLASATPTRSDTGQREITVTYDSRGGKTTPVADTKTATVGYVFDGWNTQADGGGTSYSSGASYTGNADLALFAKWKESLTGNSVTLPSVTEHSVAGFEFQGWTTDANKTKAWGDIADDKKWAANATFSPTESITLYAVWNPPVYVVSYDANGGSGAPANQYKEYNKALVLSSTKPSISPVEDPYDVTYDANGGSAARATDRVTSTTSYTFKGWAENSLVGSTAGIVTEAEWDGYATGKKHAGGDSYTANADLDLYAQYTVSTETAPAKVKLPTADRPGYTFLGWYTDAEGGTFVGDANDEIAVPDEAAKYYAHWQAYDEPQDPVTYTVIFKVPDDTDGSSVGKDSQAFTFGESKALDAGTVTPPTGKVFSHWVSEGGTTYTQKQLVSNLTNVNGDEVVLTAVWKDAPAGGSPTYTVQYYEQGTDGVTYAMKSDDTIAEAEGTQVSVPESAKVAPLGFHLDALNPAYKPNGTVVANGSTTLTVYWARNQFDVRFEKGADDATGTMAGQHFVWASGVTLTPNAFARPGWKFTGWKVTEQGGMTAQGEGFMSVQSDDAAAMAAQALGDLVADKADGSKLSWVDGDRVVLTAQWEKDTSGGNGDDDDHGGNKPGGGGDDDDNPGGGKPGGGDDDDDNRGGDKPGGGDGPGGGGSGSDADNGGGSGAERAGFTREAADGGANGKPPGTGDPMMAVLQCLGAMALLAALALALSLRQSRRSARVVGTWSMPAQRAVSKHPTPRKVDRGRHARR